MKFSDRFYAIGNFEKKRLRIRYVSIPGSLPNQGADELQTICNSMLSFFLVEVRTFTGGNV